jgi:hypothetical protein
MLAPKDAAPRSAQRMKDDAGHAHTRTPNHDPDARAKLRRVVAGVLTGVTERFLSHPIETCKVVLQNTPASSLAVQVISSRWREKGLASFYRGASHPTYFAPANRLTLAVTVRHCAKHPGPRLSDFPSVSRDRCVPPTVP